MKACPKCNMMNRSYEASCKGCGYSMIDKERYAYARTNVTYHSEDADRPQFTSDIFNGETSQKHAFRHANKTRVKPIRPDSAVMGSNDIIQTVEYIIDEPQPAAAFRTRRPQAENPVEMHAAASGSFPKWLYLVCACLAVLVICASAFYFLNTSQSTNTAGNDTTLLKQLFVEAERHYVTGNYSLALANYRKVVDEAKDETMLLTASERIKELSTAQANRLITNAETALRRERYAVPADDNAILYVNKVLAINPNHPVALDIQQEIVLHFESLAFTATEKGRLEEIKRCYKNILAVKPYDMYAQEELRKVRALLEEKTGKAVSPFRKKASAHLPNSEAEKPASAEVVKITTEPLEPRLVRHKSQTIQYLDSRQMNPVKAIPVGNAPGKSAASVENIVKADTASKSSANHIKIVNEFNTDQGERVYLQKAAPKLPVDWRYEGYVIVRAECIVEADGRVEIVKINSVFSPNVPSGKHELLKNISVETLKKYRYKAPTQNGHPVRISLKEALRFQ